MPKIERSVKEYSEEEINKIRDNVRSIINYGIYPVDTVKGIVLQNLKLVIATSIYGHRIDTAATDGIHLIINPNFWGGLNSSEKKGLLIHEGMHVFLEHPIREAKINKEKKSANHTLWNYATDYAINSLIKRFDAINGAHLPEGALYDEKYKYMIAEAIYDALKKEEDEQEKQEPPHGPGGDPGGDPEEPEDNDDNDDDSEQEDGPEPDEPIIKKSKKGGKGKSLKGKKPDYGEDVISIDDIEVKDENGNPMSRQDKINKIRENIKKGIRELEDKIQKSKITGKELSSMDKLSSDILKTSQSKIDWKRILNEYFYETFPQNDPSLTWKRWNKKYNTVRSDAGLPIVKGEIKEEYEDIVGTLVIGIDTSGSIDKDMVMKFLAETAKILEQISLDSDNVDVDVKMIYCDDKILKKEEFKINMYNNKLPFNGDIPGNGGTDYRPVFNYVRDELGDNINCMIYLTDLDPNGGIFPPEPSYPVLWGLTNNSKNIQVSDDGDSPDVKYGKVIIF